MIFYDRLSPRAKRVSWFFSICIFIYFVVQIVRTMYFPELPVPVTSLVQNRNAVIALRLPRAATEPQEEIIISARENSQNVTKRFARRQPVQISRTIDEDYLGATRLIELRDDEWVALQQLWDEWCAASFTQEHTLSKNDTYEIGVRCPTHSSPFNSKGIAVSSENLPPILQEIIRNTAKG